MLHALDGGYVPAGPSGSPTRGLVNVLPTGRNFYSVDPKAIPSPQRVGGRRGAGRLAARPAPGRHRRVPAVGRADRVGHVSAMRTQGDDIAEVLALLGCRPVWDDASRRVTGFEVVPLDELGRPRIDVTVRISGFFRDAFPHVVALLDDAVARGRRWTSRRSRTTCARTSTSDAAPSTATGGAADGADLRLQAGRLRRRAAAADRRAQLAQRRRPRRGLRGLGRLRLRPRARRRGGARRHGARVPRGSQVAAKNQDTREHDIVDSDDYFQYHGGMVAMVRALTGREPGGVRRRLRRPRRRCGPARWPRRRTRVFRARVVNPRWIAAMQRHGYKGAFELAATVDYLFGYDATAGVVDDWMYEQLAASYVFDADEPGVHGAVQPVGAARASPSGCWRRPTAACGRSRRTQALDRLRDAYLELEGDLEGDD